MNIYNERNYYTTLKFVLIKATYDLFPEAEVKIHHSLNMGIYGEIIKNPKIKSEEIRSIKERMEEIIRDDRPISQVIMPVSDIQKYDCIYNRPDIRRLIDNSSWTDIRVYELEGFYDYYHNGMLKSTGFLNLFDLTSYNGGFILKYPFQNNPYKIPVETDHPKLAKIFHESESWGHIMEVSDVGALNEKILNNEIGELIMINEALHHKKIAFIADEICKNPEIKVVPVAGPSSSGKTTFTKRLAIHLKVNGLKPVVISLDNYYKGRKLLPSDENGKKDFESIKALDIKLLNQHLKELIEGKEVVIPKYNFINGEREGNGSRVKIEKNGIILIEGIHGLNDELTCEIPKKNKFKIYISCLTTLNVDDHNRIPTSEVRKLRRIVRDSLSRGTDAEGTLHMWESVRRGEEENIFPFQEEADAIFDSNLIYEIGVLKKYALVELKKIEKESPHYEEAQRLIKFLNYLREIDKEFVPDDSILKEFIGGSYFYKY
jgi:uridine kinase